MIWPRTADHQIVEFEADRGGRETMPSSRSARPRPDRRNIVRAPLPVPQHRSTDIAHYPAHRDCHRSPEPQFLGNTGVAARSDAIWPEAIFSERGLNKGKRSDVGLRPSRCGKSRQRGFPAAARPDSSRAAMILCDGPSFVTIPNPTAPPSPIHSAQRRRSPLGEAARPVNALDLELRREHSTAAIVKQGGDLALPWR